MSIRLKYPKYPIKFSRQKNLFDGFKSIADTYMMPRGYLLSDGGFERDSQMMKADMVTIGSDMKKATRQVSKVKAPSISSYGKAYRATRNK